MLECCQDATIWCIFEGAHRSNDDIFMRLQWARITTKAPLMMIKNGHYIILYATCIITIGGSFDRAVDSHRTAPDLMALVMVKFEDICATQTNQ